MQDQRSMRMAAREAARRHSGGIAWPTVILGITVFIAYWSLPFLVMLGGLSLAVAIPLMTMLTYYAYTVVHEAVHGCISGNVKSLQWFNDGLGYLASSMLFAPLTAHRHEHLSHHRNTNHSDDDPDSYSENIIKSPWHMVSSVWRATSIQYKFYITHRWRLAPKSQNRTFILEIVGSITLRLLPFLLLYLVGDAAALERWWQGIVLFIVAGFLGTVVLVYLFAYIVHRPHKSTAQYRNTSTILIRGPLSSLLTILWGYQNYHSIHHLFPWIPFYRYRRLYNEIEETMHAMEAPIYNLTWRGLQPVHNNDGNEKLAFSSQ